MLLIEHPNKRATLQKILFIAFSCTAKFFTSIQSTGKRWTLETEKGRAKMTSKQKVISGIVVL